MKSLPHLKFEVELWKKDMLVCGIDEVGRGAFAGPLVVGAVVLKPVKKASELRKLLSMGINDSKLVIPKRRKLIAECIQEYILYSSLQYILVEQINTIGVGKSNKLGFEKAAKTVLKQLKTGDKTQTTNNLFFLTDAFKIPNINNSVQLNIIRGDQTSLSIATASILAKVARDTYMETLGNEYPQYEFARHKGYGTLVHRNSIKQYGISPHHRTAFIHFS